MKKLLVVITKLNAEYNDAKEYLEKLKEDESNELKGLDEWCDEFIEHTMNSNFSTDIKPISDKLKGISKICEYVRRTDGELVCYLLHGCTKYWMVNNDLHPNTEKILEEISKIIDEEKNEKKEVKIGFICHSNQWDHQFKQIVKKIFKEEVEFCGKVSSDDSDPQFINYANLFTPQGNLNVHSFNKMWQYYSEKENLKAFHHFLTLKMIHLETVRVLLTRKENQKASREYENEFGNDSLRTFIEDKVKKNSEYIRYCTIVGGEKNQVREYVEKLNPESYSHLDKNNLEVKPLEDFIQWFNKFSECVAEELA